MQKRKFFKNIHYLRAFAIICIMTVHVWRIPPDCIASNSIISILINGTREVLFHGSSIYFIFISGFLFHHLSSNFDIIKFYRSKLRNIVSPYVVMTTGVLVIQSITHHEWHISFSKLINYYCLGKAQVQYWYIPLICIVFMISPILLKIPEKKLTLLSPLFIILPLLGTRTATSISTGQFLYFFPVYLSGMICSMHHDRFINFITTHIIKISVLAIFSTFAIICAKLIPTDNPFINFYESTQYIQKMLILSVLIVFFKKIEFLDISILDVLARYSFALYFTHHFVHSYTIRKFYVLFDVSPVFLFPLSILYTLIVFSLTVLLCFSIKKTLGPKSKFLIGV